MVLRRTKISWADYSGGDLNFAIGCSKISEGCANCLAPDTQILYADLQWRPLGAVQPGDRLVGFDEEVGTHQAYRHPQECTVEAVWRSYKPAIEIVTERTRVVASSDHKWLAGSYARWLLTDHLTLRSSLRNMGTWQNTPNSDSYLKGYLAGMTEGDGTFRYIPGTTSHSRKDLQPYWRVALKDQEPLDRLEYLLLRFGVEFPGIRNFNAGRDCMLQKLEVRSIDNLAKIAILMMDDGSADFALGWMAGFFDAEGSFGKDGNIRISQKDPGRLERFVKYAGIFGLDFRLERPSREHARTVRLYGNWAEKVRFLGMTSPALSRKVRFVSNRFASEIDRVISLRQLPKQELVDIQTDTGTFIANGLLTHNCYAAAWAKKAGRDFSTVQVYWEKLNRLWKAKWNPGDTPYRRGPDSKPIMFPVDLGDLFHPDVPSPLIQEALDMFNHRKDADWVLLTKRPHRMLEETNHWLSNKAALPPNIWCLVTVENQRRADERIPILLQVKTAVRGVSVEPMLEPINLEKYLGIFTDGSYSPYQDLRIGMPPVPNLFTCLAKPHGAVLYKKQLNWVIVGAESGPNRRPFGENWAREIRDQCKAAGIAFFFKQSSGLYPGNGPCLDDRIIQEFPI